MERRWLIGSAALVVILWLGCGDGGSPNEPDPTDTVPVAWVSSSVVYDTLMEKKDHSFILFGATWCGYCQKLEHETFGNPTVAVIIDESFNAVKIDVDADSLVMWFDSSVTCSEMAAAHEVGGYPTVVFFDRRGAAIARLVGYRSAEDYVAVLRHVRDEM